jgi:hypothetical protein
VNANLPAAYRQSLLLDGSNIEIVSSGKTSAILDYGRGNPVSYWIYALAAPFPTITDEIPAKTWQEFWQQAADAPFPGLL